MSAKSEMYEDLAQLQTKLFEFHVTHKDNYPDEDFAYQFKVMDEALQEMLGRFEQ